MGLIVFARCRVIHYGVGFCVFRIAQSEQ